MNSWALIIGGQDTTDILAVLTDWSAAGLVGSFTWVDSAHLGQDAPALRVVDGIAHGTTWQGAFSEAGASSTLVGILVPSDAEPRHSALASQVTVMVQRATNQQARRLRIVLPRTPAIPADALTVAEWENLVISPESPQGPHRASESVSLADGQPRSAHEAAAVSSLLGLWRGIGDPAPLENSGRASVRMVRSTVRGWDGGEADAQLRNEVLSLSREVPLPRGSGENVVYLDEPARAARLVADRVWGDHRSTHFVGERQHAQREAVRRVGVLDALKMFFSFLVSGLMHPLEWLRSVTDALRNEAASRVGQAIFGTGSAFEVVRSTSLNAMSADELEQLAARAEDALAAAEGRPMLEAVTNHAEVWRDYTGSALTLLDARDRGRALAVREGADLGVVSAVAVVVPPGEEVFTLGEPALPVEESLERIESFDWLGATLLESRLEDIAAEERVSSLALQARERLRQWRTTHADSSFAYRFGEQLGSAVVALYDEVGIHSATLASLQELDDLSDSRSGQRKTATLMRVLVIVALLGIGIVVGIGALAWISWLSVAGIAAGILVVAMVSSLVVFVRRQRILFKLINRQRELVSQVDAAKENLRRALSDLRRSVEGYRQFLAWSRVVRTFVQAPFGRVVSEQESARVPDGLPASVEWGQEEYPEQSRGGIVARLRVSISTVGWLSDPWRLLLEGVGARLGPDFYMLSEAPGRIFDERVGTVNSALDAWVADLEAHGAGTDAADETWMSIRARTLPTVLEQLGSPSRIRQQDGQLLSVREFINGADEQIPGQPFSYQLLSDEAQVYNRTVVSMPIAVSRVASSLGFVLIRTEATEPLRVADFNQPSGADEEIA